MVGIHKPDGSRTRRKTGFAARARHGPGEGDARRCRSTTKRSPKSGALVTPSSWPSQACRGFSIPCLGRPARRAVSASSSGATGSRLFGSNGGRRCQGPVLAPPAKPQYRCSCAVCSSCRNRAVHHSISAKTRRTSQLVRTPLSTIAPAPRRGRRLPFRRAAPCFNEAPGPSRERVFHRPVHATAHARPFRALRPASRSAPQVLESASRQRAGAGGLAVGSAARSFSLILVPGP